MDKQFFVTISIPNRRLLSNLSKIDLDLFQQTLKEQKRKGTYAIQGLLSLQQIGEMVRQGYPVQVEEESAQRSRAHLEVAELEDWLEFTKPLLKK